jgi:hypothetical protein
LPRLVGYLPSRRAPHVQALIDRRYDLLVETSGREFSPLESLVSWEHLLASGHRPRQVRVLGYGGGETSACEYRIALALGARVGLVRGSGRAAAALLRSRSWRAWPRLLGLEPTATAIGRFIGRRERRQRH